MLWVFSILGMAILALFALASWSRRGVGRPDRPGERTTAVFEAPRGPEPRDGDPHGGALARALAAALAARGTKTDTPSVGDSGGWAFLAGDAYVELGLTDDDAWSLVVLDRSSGGPGPIETAIAVDEALRHVDGVTRVRWMGRGPDDAEHDHPVDRSTSGAR